MYLPYFRRYMTSIYHGPPSGSEDPEDKVAWD